MPFTAQTRMSGVDIRDNGTIVHIRKGAADTVAHWLREQQGTVPGEVTATVDDIARRGGTPLVVARGAEVAGVVELSDVVKTGMAQRFAQLRAMGVRTVMITGDNPLTAKAIAAEAGVDDYLAEATPEDKLALIRSEKQGGRLVAMTGDGTNDGPALAQADVADPGRTGRLDPGNVRRRPTLMSTYGDPDDCACPRGTRGSARRGRATHRYSSESHRPPHGHPAPPGVLLLRVR